MAFSMHSHSGQFCPGHAKDTLEEVIQTAISKGMQTFAFTEHMPRNSNKDRYPEEDTIDNLAPLHQAFLIEAARLRTKYASQITILIGFEGEYIRSSYGPFVKELAANPIVDYFIGSVHHVHEIPIDYDTAMYQSARAIAGGTDAQLFEDYFDLQYEMLNALSPRVVGHMDLIRLLSDEPNRDLKSMPGVWAKITRNLELIVEQGGLMEVNSSALRKGLQEPYPTRSVCVEYLKMGGRLTMGDDSHGVVQVGACFGDAIAYLESLGVEEVFTLGSRAGLKSGATPSVKGVKLADVKESFRD